jgi:hypothetical protein
LRRTAGRRNDSGVPAKRTKWLILLLGALAGFIGGAAAADPDPREETAWKRAKSRETPPATEDYLLRYPRGRYAIEAMERLSGILNRSLPQPPGTLLLDPFIDGSAVGPIDEGTACEAPGLAAMEAFQIELVPRAERSAASGSADDATTDRSVAARPAAPRASTPKSPARSSRH